MRNQISEDEGWESWLIVYLWGKYYGPVLSSVFPCLLSPGKHFVLHPPYYVVLFKVPEVTGTSMWCWHTHIQKERKSDTLTLFSTFNLICSFIFQSKDNLTCGHTKMSSWDGIAPSIIHFGKPHTRHSSTWSMKHGINICNTTQKKVLENQCARGYQMCL